MVRRLANWLLRLTGLAICIAGLAGAGWAYLKADQAKSLADPARARREARPIPVRTARVARIEAEQLIGGTAVTAPSETALIQVGPLRARETDPVSETIIKKVHVRDGDRVESGQLLVELDDQVAVHTLLQRQATLEAAAKVVKLRTENVEDKRKLLDMMLKLERAKSGTKAQSLEAELALNVARFELAEAELRLKVAEVDYESARRNSERYRITSPTDGFVGSVDAVSGMIVTAPTVLTRVLRLDPIHVVMDCPQERIGDLSIGQEAEVVLDSFPDETFRGSVSRILPQADPELRVLPVVVELANPDHRIKAGVTGYVRLRLGRPATVVPDIAVLRDGGRSAVFAVENGKAEARIVETGPLLETGLREVFGGLAPGDEVVVFQNFYRHGGRAERTRAYLRDSDAVDVDWQTWARRD